MHMTFLLYEGIEPVDLAAIGVISMARRVIPGLSYETVSFDREPVLLANGLEVVPGKRFDEVSKVDVLLVPGGPGWRAAANDARVLAFVRRVAPDALVCSVCTGAMILAQAGVLDGLRATTKFEVVPPEASPLDELWQRYPAIRSEPALVVDNGRVVTGGGVTLCIDAVLYLLEKRFGKQAAHEVARIMEYGAARAANAQRFAPVVPAP
jgi:transcriptional regulator GlxA family with amidase domain